MMETLRPSNEFPTKTPHEASSTSQPPLRCPAPAGQTPPPQDRPTATTNSFVPSPVECASPTTGTLYHPATPIPAGAVFHDTPASPVPTFAINDENPPQSSPVLCGPTPTSTPVPAHPTYAQSPRPTNVEFATETYSNSPTPAAPPHLSTIKGNITSFVGKVTHNPDKQQAGNVMIANRKEEKAAFFEQKATEWELKGNTAKAQKNREKAARYRQVAQAKLNAPLTTPTNKTAAKMEKVARLDAKAQEYERKGDEARAVKCHNKAYELRQKYKLSQPIGGPTTSGATIINATPIGPAL